MLKCQKINNHRSQENCTTPKKNNGQCKYTILSFLLYIRNWYINCQFYKIQNYIDILNYTHIVLQIIQK